MLAVGCTKGYVPGQQDDRAQEVEVRFNAEANFSVNYTRATADTYNGVIGAINSVEGWEFAPDEVAFDGLVGNATTSQAISTTPEKVVVATGPYTFVSCAVSGAGKVALDGSSVALVGGQQTADNDVVWCATQATVTAQEGKPFGVQFDYGHVFSAVRFELNAEGKNAEALMAETTLNGVSNLNLALDGVLNIQNGVISNAQNTLGKDETIKWATNYLVLPGESQPGELSVSYRGVEFKGTLPAKSFLPGQRTVVSITLNTADITCSATIKEWEVVEEKVTLE